MKHIHKWIYALVSNLDKNVAEKTKILVLENGGRACIAESMKQRAKKAKQESKDMQEFLNNLSMVWGHLKLKGKDIYYMLNIQGVIAQLWSCSWVICLNHGVIVRGGGLKNCSSRRSTSQ